MLSISKLNESLGFLEELLIEAEYYGLESLVSLLQKQLQTESSNEKANANNNNYDKKNSNNRNNTGSHTDNYNTLSPLFSEPLVSISTANNNTLQSDNNK